jgi:hypothetical protein
VQDHPIGVERGAGVEALGFAPGEERFDVLRGDFAEIGLGGGVLRKEFQVEGVGLAKRLDVFQKRRDNGVEREFGFSSGSVISRPVSLASSSRRFLFWASSAWAE